MLACPRCGRSVPDKRTCLYCGEPLSVQPTTVLGMNAIEWVEEGIRVAELRQWERAISCFDKALQLEPNHAVVLFDKAVVLSDAGRPEEALAVARAAQRLAPDDAEIAGLIARLESPNDPPPHGRSGGGAVADRWVLHTASALHQKLGLFAPEAIVAINWIVDVPRMSRWTTVAHGGLHCHVLLGDRTAFVLRTAPGEEMLDDHAIPQLDFEAAGALLESGTLRRVVFCGDRPFALSVFARVNEINERLAGFGVGPERHVELLRIDDA